MALNNIKLSKGMKFNLSKDDDKLKSVSVTLTWDDSKFKNNNLDADLSIAMLEALGENKRVIYGEDVSNLIYYRSDNCYFMDTNPPTKTTYEETQKPENSDRPINICSANNEVRHTGDNRDGSGDGEVATIDLSAMKDDVAEIAIVGTIHKGRQRGQSWSDLNAVLTLKNTTNNETLAQINLGDKLPGDTAVHFASLYRDENGDWQFEAIERGSDVGLEFFISQWDGS